MKNTFRNTAVLALVALLTIGSVFPVFADESTVFIAYRGTTYYTFDYTGDDSDITIEAYATPGDANAMSAFELKLIEPDGTIETGEAGEAVYTIETSSDTAGTYTLVFSNYHEDLPITVTLFVNGDAVSNLAAATDEAEAEVTEEETTSEETEEVTEEETATETETTSTVAAGVAFPATTTSDGEAAYGPWWVATGRAFTYAVFEYAGDESTVTVELGVNPGDANAMSGVVLKVYDADGELIATGEADDAMYVAEFDSDVAGTYVIEAISYNADLPLGFSVVVKGDGVTGATGISAGGEQMDVIDLTALSVEESSAAASTEEAATEDETEEADTETTESTVTAGAPVWFNMDKGFAYYTFDYAGSSDDITIEVWPIPGDAQAMNGVTIKLFAPDGSIVDEATAGDAVFTLETTISTNGTYTIEVANYHEELPLTFCMEVTGSNIGAVAAE